MVDLVDVVIGQVFQFDRRVLQDGGLVEGHVLAHGPRDPRKLHQLINLELLNDFFAEVFVVFFLLARVGFEKRKLEERNKQVLQDGQLDEWVVVHVFDLSLVKKMLEETVRE